MSQSLGGFSVLLGVSAVRDAAPPAVSDDVGLAGGFTEGGPGYVIFSVLLNLYTIKAEANKNT